MQKYRFMCALVLLVFIVAGCGGGGSGSQGSATGQRQWTVLLYIDGNNNLDSDAKINMNDLEAVGSTSSVAMVTQLAVLNSPTKRYYITKDSDHNNISSKLLQTMGTVDMASSANLNDFIKWGVANYPADHYMLVLWDHGGGWRTTRAITQPRAIKSIFQDDTFGTEMSLAELNSALNGTPKMDAIVFDACLMGMLEVGASIKGHANLMIASEELVPGQGLPYTAIMSSLVANPSIDRVSFGRTIVDQYLKAYSSPVYESIALSMINLDALGDLETATDQLSTAIINNISTVKTNVESAQSNSQHFDYDSSSTSHVYAAVYKDLYDFASRLTSTGSTAVNTSAQAVMQAVNNTVTYEGHYSDYMKNAHGISIFLPPPGDSTWSSWQSEYNTLQFATDTSWNEMIAQY